MDGDQCTTTMNAWLEEINRQIGWRTWLGTVLWNFGAGKYTLRKVLGLSEYEIHKIVERGKVTPAFKVAIFRRDNFTCYLCGHYKCWIGGFPMIVEHKLPVSRGGQTTKQNCACACWHCNDAKGVMTEEEYRATKRR